MQPSSPRLKNEYNNCVFLVDPRELKNLILLPKNKYKQYT